MSFEEDGAPPDTSRARSVSRRRAYTVSRGQRRWTSRRSPSPVRSGEAVTQLYPPARDEPSTTTVVQVGDSYDGRSSEVTAVDSKVVSVTPTATPGSTSASTTSSSAVGGKDTPDDFPSLDDQDETGINKLVNKALVAPPPTRLSLVSENTDGSCSVVAVPAAVAATSGITSGVLSSAAGTTPVMHHSGTPQVRLDEADSTSIKQSPTIFEEDGDDTSRASRVTRRRAYTVSRGHRRWTPSRSPSPARSGEAGTTLSPPARDELRNTPAAQAGASDERRSSQACSSFKTGDRVVDSNRFGIEERDMILTVYRGRCKFQANTIYNQGRTASSSLFLNQAVWDCSSFEVGGKVVYSDQDGVQEPGEIVTMYDDFSYEFRAVGLVQIVDACDLLPLTKLARPALLSRITKALSTPIKMKSGSQAGLSPETPTAAAVVRLWMRPMFSATTLTRLPPRPNATRRTRQNLPLRLPPSPRP